jgi:hypothetical protein
MRIGYMRVSSETQNLARQDLGDVDKVFEEKVSGASAKDRPALNDLMDLPAKAMKSSCGQSTGWPVTCGIASPS